MIVENINKALFTSIGQVEDSKETQEILGRFMSPQISIKLVTGFIKKTKKKKALKKSASDSLRDIFIQWMNTHTHTLATSQRDLPQSSFDREKLIKRFQLQQKVTKNPKRYTL